MITRIVHFLLNKHLFFFLNRGKGLTSRVRHTPRVIRIETTNCCNLRCITCPQNLEEYKREKKFMDKKLFMKIVDEIKTFRPKPMVVLYIGGEPLLNPQLFDFIRILKDNRFYVDFNTNATLLNEENAKKIINSRLDHISFSFDDVPLEEYERMRVNAKYPETLKNILSFLKLRGNGKPLVEISGIEMRSGRLADEVKKGVVSDNFKNLFRPYKVKLSMVYAHKWSNANPPEYKRCYMVFRDFNILSDGKCVPCCYDLAGKLVLGDVNTERIKDIWNNAKYRHLRKMLNRLEHKKIVLCKGCSL